MAGQNFWVSNQSEPKRKHRFLVSLGNVGGQAGINEFVAQSAQRPNFKVGSTSHHFLDKEFKYPGKVTWDDVTISIVDALAPNSAAIIFDILRKSGYVIPTQITPALQRQELTTVSKRRAIAALGPVRVKQLNSEGDIHEEWVLKQAWISGIDLGEVSYESEDALNISITITFDWAEFRSTGIPLRPIPV